MMRPQEEGRLAPVEPVDQRGVPGRALGIERDGLDQGDHVEHLAQVARSRDRDGPDVPVRIEVRVGDPMRTAPDVARVPRSLPQTLGVLGRDPEAVNQVRASRRPVQDHEVPDCHAQPGILADPPHDRFDRAQRIGHRSISISILRGLRVHLIVIGYCPPGANATVLAPRGGEAVPARRLQEWRAWPRAGAPGDRSGPGGQGVLDNLIEDASGVIQSVANEVAPGVVGAIDINGVVQRVDIEAVVDRVDIQRIVSRVDLQEVIERVDLNSVLEGIDLDAVLARADLNQLISRIDLNAVIDKVDVDTIIDKVDINALLARADINSMVEKIDMEAIIDKLDINAIVARVDIDALVERTEIGSIIAATGAGIAGKAIDVARSQGVGLDFLVQRWTDRILRRRRSPRPGVPPRLVREEEAVSP